MKKWRQYSTAVFLASLFLWGGSTSGWAYFQPQIYSLLGKERKTGFRLGRTHIHTLLGIITTYDSNAWFADNNERDDWIFHIIPGIDILRPGQKLEWSANYRFTLQKNLHQDVQDHRGHLAKLEAGYSFSRNLSLKVGDEFEITSDPADVEIPERLGRLTNEAHAEIGYKTPGEGWVSSLRYIHTYREYDAELDALSFFSNKVRLTSRINASSQFRFLPKSILVGNVEYGQTHFRNDPTVIPTNNDSWGVSGSLGLTSQFTRKISASMDLGLNTLFFEAGPNDVSVIGGVRVMYQPNPSFSFSTGYQRNSRVSTFTNFYNQHLWFLESSWKFALRFQADLKSRFSLLDFSGPNSNLNNLYREDFVTEILCGVSYAVLDWIQTRVAYEMDFRDSNATHPVWGTNTADFMKHRVSFGIDFNF